MSLVYSQIAASGSIAADTDETLYTVPTSNRVVGQLLVTNTSSVANRTFRLAVRGNGGDALAAKHYIAYDVTLTPGEVVSFSGVTLEAGDIIMARSDAISNTTAGTGIIFQLYGELDNNVI